MADPPVVTLLVTVTVLVVWSVLAGARVRARVLSALATWTRADSLQVATVRAGVVQLVGLVVMSSWVLLAWFLGALAGATAVTRAMLLLAAAVLGPLWWAQGGVLPGAEPTRRALERAGVPVEQAPTVAGIAAWGSLVAAVGLVSTGAPSLWVDAGPALP